MKSENTTPSSRSLTARLISMSLVAIAISANFTNYGGIQATLQDDLHITNESIGFLSTLLYLGIACGYVAGGGLVDRFGPRRVLIAALLTMGLGNAELSMMPHLTCVFLCRFLIGIGAGIGIVAGSQTAARFPGRAASVGQGLFGGAMQVGSGLGLFASPLLLPYLGWEGIFAFWGGLALLLAWQWTIWKEVSEVTSPPSQKSFWQRFLKASRQPQLVALGVIHMGTLGMGQAVAPWLAVFFASSLVRCGAWSQRFVARGRDTTTRRTAAHTSCLEIPPFATLWAACVDRATRPDPLSHRLADSLCWTSASHSPCADFSVGPLARCHRLDVTLQ